MLTHGIRKQSVYNSEYGLVNCVNHDLSFGFNANNSEFPNFDEQREIAEGFLEKSGADFDTIIVAIAIDGMFLIWTNRPSAADCGHPLIHCLGR